MKTKYLEEIKRWNVVLIYDVTPRVLEEGVPIEKIDLHIPSMYYFVFINRIVMLSHYEFVLRLSKAACLRMIIE